MPKILLGLALVLISLFSASLSYAEDEFCFATDTYASQACYSDRDYCEKARKQSSDTNGADTVSNVCRKGKWTDSFLAQRAKSLRRCFSWRPSNKLERACYKSLAGCESGRKEAAGRGKPELAVSNNCFFEFPEKKTTKNVSPESIEDANGEKTVSGTTKEGKKSSHKNSEGTDVR